MKVGDEDKKGISGGQRRRVSIGIDLLKDPKIMFLDEPISGLDSTSAYRVVKAIKDVTVSLLRGYTARTWKGKCSTH